MVEKYIKSNLCHLPWSSIETRRDGKYKPCCLYKNILKDNGIIYNTKEHTISDVINSPAMKNLREQFLNGEKPAGCESCWKEEQTGKISKRQHMWYKAGTLGEIYIKKNKVAPAFIALKLGNVCNLKCRICAPDASSQWANDMIKLDPGRKDHWKKLNKERFWPRKKNKFFDDIDNHLEEIRFFEITGGEPLMIQEHFDILQKCIDRGVANKIEVHYNTNGTQFSEHAIKNIWPKFKKVEVAFSIDDIGDRFEYQRYPANWYEVKENIMKYKLCALDNFSMQISTTINIFNIYYIDEMTDFIDEISPDFWHINILHNPAEFDIQQLDKSVKRAIVEKLSSCKKYKNQIKSAIDYLNAEPNYIVPDHKNKLINKIKIIDILRKENFSKIFSAFNSILKIPT